MNAIFDALLRPLSGCSPWCGITLIALLTGIIMLLIFRSTSNQRAIRRAKDRIRAHLLEVRLYRDDVGVLLRAQKDILRHNLVYLAHSLAPLAVMIIPVVLILVQLNAYYGYRPLRPGEATILAVRFAPGTDLNAVSPRLIVPAGLSVETPALHIPTLGEVNWRIGAARPGRFTVRIAAAGQEVTKQVVVSHRRVRVTAQRVSSALWERVLNPGERPLPRESPISAVVVAYTPAALPFLRWNLHWLVGFFVLSIAFGFALKGVFKVEV